MKLIIVTVTVILILGVWFFSNIDYKTYIGTLTVASGMMFVIYKLNENEVESKG